MTRPFFKILASLLLVATSGCAYNFQTSKGSSLADLGIHRIYVAPLRNDTYKAGVENLLYNELVQSVSAGRRVKIVSDPELADAVLRGTVVQADYAASASTDSNALFGTREKVITMRVATEYQAVVSTQFSLVRVADLKATEPKVIWSSAFTRAKRFPASNQKGVFGNTSPLINESEFDRSLREMAREMMLEVHESMFAMF